MRQWVGGFRSHSELCFVENHPKIPINQLRYFGVVLSVYTLLKVVSYYDLNVLYMSVMDFKKSLDGELVGGG